MRLERARNKGTTGPKRFNDTRCTTYRETPPARTLQQDYTYGPVVVLGGGLLKHTRCAAYERPRRQVSLAAPSVLCRKIGLSFVEEVEGMQLPQKQLPASLSGIHCYFS